MIYATPLVWKKIENYAWYDVNILGWSNYLLKYSSNTIWQYYFNDDTQM